MMKKLLLLAATALLSLPFAVKAQLVITQNGNATQMAQALVGNGVTITNATMTGQAAQGGTFTGGTSVGLGFNNGIILSTGNVGDIDQNGSAFASTDYAGGGDANLNAILGGNLTQEAKVLEFDLVPQGNTLNFRYVFGSEEYPEYVCSDYNDIFAFLITGANPGGGNYTNSNIAIIPNTSLSVTINSLNPGVVGANGTPGGCTSLAHSNLYINNNNSNFQPVFDGYTVVLNANVGVVPCSTYHLKMAIADVFDGVFDSGVFVEAQSLVTASASVTASYDPGFTTTFEGCTGGYFTITMPNLATSSTAISYTVSGTATNGVDYPTLNGTAFVNPGTSSALVYVDPLTDAIAEGQETVTITINDPCTGMPMSSATITINDKPADTAYASKAVACLGEQVQLTATGGGTYSWSPPGAVSNPNIANPTATVNSPTTFSVQIDFGTCSTTRTVFVAADSFSVGIQAVANGVLCPGTTDTLVVIENGGYGPFTYQWTGPVSNPTGNFVSTAPTVNTNYTVVVTDNVGCTASANYTLQVATNLQISLGPDVNICPEDTPYVISVPGGPYGSYLWSNGATTPTISVYASGNYSVTTTQGQCTYSSDTIGVNIYTPVNPQLGGADFCSNDSVTLSVFPGLTGVIWSTGATTSSITVNTPGTYYYSADDVNGCRVYSDTATLTALTIPVVNLDATPDTICPNTPSTIQSGTASGLTYNWSTNETTQNIVVTSGGTYYFTVSDGVCSNYDTITVYEFPNPQPLVAADTTVCNGEPVTFHVVNGPFASYTWSNGSTGADSITVTQPGTYTVSVDDDNKCVWSSNSVTLSNFNTPQPTLTDTGACTGETVTLWTENGLVNIVWNTQATTPTIDVTSDGTFYYTAQDANGCPVASDTIDVTFLAAPTVNATTTEDTICPGASATIDANATGTNLSYVWSPGGETTASITVTQAGVYTVVVSNGFCPAYDTVEISVYQFPPVTVGADQTVCSGDSAILTASGGPYVSYNWSNGVTSATDTVFAPGNYWVTVNNGTCLLVSDTMTLSNFPGSNPTLNDSTLCLGGTVVLSAPQDFTDVVWSNGAQGVSITVTANGDYSFTGTTPDGCDAVSDTATITFVNPPAVNADATPDTICAGGSSVINANSSGNVTYLWSPGGETTASITATQAGTYSVIVSDGSCQGFDTVTVYQFTAPTVVLSNDTTVCPGSTVTVSVSGSPYVSYVWSNGATTPTITVSTPGSYSVNVNDGNCTYPSDTFTLSNFQVSAATLNDSTLCLGGTVVLNAGNFTGVVWSTGAQGNSISVTTTGNYSYTASTADGCAVTSDTATITFTTAPTVNADATPDTLFCPGSSSVINANSSGNVTYLWAPGGQTTASITVTQPGTYSVIVSDGSCSSYDTVTVYQSTHAPVLLRNDTAVCPGASVTLSPSGSPYVTYLWSNQATTATITVSAPGNYSVTVNDGNCTYVSDTFTLSNVQVATPVAYSDTSVCAGEPVTLFGDVGYTNYNWGGGLTGVSVTVTTPGNYSYTATDANGCSVTSTTASVTNRPYPNPNITATPPAVCVGQGSTTLNAGSEANVTYVWQPGGSTGSTLQVTQPGTYTVQATLNGCVKGDTLTVNAADTPTLSLAPQKSCCAQVVLDPAPQQNYTFLWSDGSTGSTLTVINTGDSTETYSVTATNSAGCTSNASVTVQIKCVEASASASPDTVFAGDSTQLAVVTAYNGNFSYSWSPTATLTGANTSTPTATPADETTYVVVVTDTVDGCADTASVIVYVQFGQVIMPNAFTPNGDGKNDDFYPVILSERQVVTEFRIYDRWGAMVHNSVDPWFGDFNGKAQPAGTYTYYIVVRIPDPNSDSGTRDQKIQGSFTLLH
jgi:gliding motility-associated-like protein